MNQWQFKISHHWQSLANTIESRPLLEIHTKGEWLTTTLVQLSSLIINLVKQQFTTQALLVWELYKQQKTLEVNRQIIVNRHAALRRETAIKYLMPQAEISTVKIQPTNSKILKLIWTKLKRLLLITRYLINDSRKRTYKHTIKLKRRSWYNREGR